MDLPTPLKSNIESRAEGLDHRRLLELAQSLSDRYRTESGQGRPLVSQADEALVYSLVRLPATYGAVRAALTEALSATRYRPRTLLDAGAGTGAASWAADSLVDLSRVTSLEREDSMRRLGEELGQSGSKALKEARWLKFDIRSRAPLGQADLVVASYVLNELTAGDRQQSLAKLWAAAGGMLLLVEPGTPEGYGQLNRARQFLLDQGARLAAPCPHEEPCRLPAGDWCHFACRVARSRLHRFLKTGLAPYEDEKFSYLALTRSAGEPAPARVRRHPYLENGKVTLELCTARGQEKKIITRRDGELYKRARKAKCGDCFPI